MRLTTRTIFGVVGTVMLVGTAVPAMQARAAGADGVLIVNRTTSGGATSTSQIQIDQNHMRAEMADSSGAKQAMVFDGVKQVMYIINTDKKTYSEMTKADMDRLGAQMGDAMAQMQAALEKMPPAQRAQMEQMMKGRMGAAGAAAAGPKAEYKKTGTDKVGRWTCDKYEGYQNGQKTSEVCTVEPTALGLALSDTNVSKQFAEFFKKLMPQAGDQMFGVGKVEEQGFSGVPVRRVSNIGGKETTTEIVEVTRQAFPESVFAVPEGFKKQDMGLGRGRGGW